MEVIYPAICFIRKKWYSTCIFICVHIDAKQLLKRLAFLVKCEIRYLSDTTLISFTDICPIGRKMPICKSSNKCVDKKNIRFLRSRDRQKD